MTIADQDAPHHQILNSTAYETAYSLVPHLDALQCVFLLNSLFTYLFGTELLKTLLIQRRSTFQEDYHGTRKFQELFHLRSPQKPCTTFHNILYFLR
jgi:hypothetical protein